MSTDYAFEKLPSHKLYINGSWVDPVKGGTFSTINPATGSSGFFELDRKSDSDIINCNFNTAIDTILSSSKDNNFRRLQELRYQKLPMVPQKTSILQ
jgi:hypothetical protein